VIDSRPSQSKPDRGMILLSWEVINQQAETVLTMKAWGMYRRRPQA